MTTMIPPTFFLEGRLRPVRDCRGKSIQVAGEKDKINDVPFHTDHDLDLRGYVRWKRLYGCRGDRPLSLDHHKYFTILGAIRDKCKPFGIDEKLLADALDPEYHDSLNPACEELAFQLLENIVLRMDLESSGETHLARSEKVIPDSIINEIALLMVESCGDNGTPPPNSLSILLRVQLNRLEDLSFIPKDSKAKDLAVLLYACDRTLSTRKVARAVGVDHTTVSRWKQETDFQNKIDTFGEVSNPRRLVDQLLQRTR
jgi:hypothetical protein